MHFAVDFEWDSSLLRAVRDGARSTNSFAVAGLSRPTSSSAGKVGCVTVAAAENVEGRGPAREQGRTKEGGYEDRT